MTWRLFIDSSNGVDVYPEWDFELGHAKIEDVHRTRSGREYRYKWGDFDRWEFSVSFVNSEFRSIVNSWWRSNADLLWMEEGGTEVHSVHIVNGEVPVSGYVRPYTDLFSGAIELETY